MNESLYTCRGILVAIVYAAIFWVIAAIVALGFLYLIQHI